MCVYKFTFSNGMYYYGATTNFGERIYVHMKRMETGEAAKSILLAASVSTFIKFEIVRYVNDKSKLMECEESYLIRNVGLPMCLNTEEHCSASFCRYKSKQRIAKCDLDGNILEIFDSPAIAAKILGTNVRNVNTATKVKYPKTKYALRRINEKGDITIPIKPYREYPSFRKAVNQYDKQMNFIKQFDSIMEAARCIGVDRKSISGIIKGKVLTSGGFIFREIDKNGKIIEPLYIGLKRKKSSGMYNKTPTKPINKIGLNGQVVETYRSVYMAIKTIPIDRRVLSKALKRNTSFNGFTYKYA